MTKVTAQTILDGLRSITLPQGQKNIVDLELVSGIAVREVSGGAQVSFAIEVDPKLGATLEPMRKAAEAAVAALPGIAGVSAVLTAHNPKLNTKPASNGPHGQLSKEKIHLPNIKHIVAVASGKGGVGKSTTAVNLAIAMHMNGLKVGLLDADIYGPSVPRMLKLSGKPEATDDKKLIPMERYGIAAMSMGFLIAEDMPMIWRGPMVHSAITQLFRDVNWGTRDVIVVDLPPGTGDAQLTMVQNVELSGAVIVSTPQDIALIDARKGLNMFKRVEVPVLGIIENMSYFLCPHCGERSDIFSHGGAHAEADKLELPFLGEIPLNIAVRETSDAGEPITASQPDSDIAQNYRRIAENVWKALEARKV